MSDFLLLLLAFAVAAGAFPSLRERLRAETTAPNRYREIALALVTAVFLSLALLGTRMASEGATTGLALLAVTVLAFVCASLASPGGRKTAPLADQIDRLLPQTQCGQCGYPGCMPYANAIAAGEADINQCPPGGEAGVRALARLLGRDPKPLNPANGVEKPKRVALIREPECIGCTKCIQACPVDAIVGASKSMHVVIADLCTGCELCIPPCPVDCIDLVPVEE